MEAYRPHIVNWAVSIHECLHRGEGKIVVDKLSYVCQLGAPRPPMSFAHVASLESASPCPQHAWFFSKSRYFLTLVSTCPSRALSRGFRLIIGAASDACVSIALCMFLFDDSGIKDVKVQQYKSKPRLSTPSSPLVVDVPSRGGPVDAGGG